MRIIQIMVAASFFASSPCAFAQRSLSGEECLARSSNADARECLAAKVSHTAAVLVQAELLPSNLSNVLAKTLRHGGEQWPH